MMNDNKLIVTSSPHVTSGDSVRRVMRTVLIALLPAMVMSYVFFGIKAINIILVSTAACLVFEAGCLLVRKQPVLPSLFDGSAIITGILLAFNLSSEVPLWLPVVGAAAAIIAAKHAFGGLGRNIFNPALIGRGFLLAAYPAYMTTWSPPLNRHMVDGMTYATPLAIVKEKIGTTLPGYLDMFIGDIGGCLGETSALILILGGLYMWHKKVITLHIPLAYIGTVALCMFLLGKDPLFHILAGGLILGAVFMATDMVTSPVTRKGMIIFGIGCGLMTVIIRLFGKYPEGVSYSILFMNACTPLIDRYTTPRRFGSV